MSIKGMIKTLLDIACCIISYGILMKLFNFTVDASGVAMLLAIRAIALHYYTDFEQLK